jgi:RNA polymerase sigma factor (sigma-70 family)
MVSLSSNNGTGVLSSAPVSPVEPAEMGVSEINKDSAPRLKGRIAPGPSFMDIKNISLRELVEHCLKQQDDQGWREFDRRTRPTVRGVVAKRLRLYRVKPANEPMEEITQDTFLNLFNHDFRALRKDWVDDASIFKFVKVVGHNAVVDWLRKNKGFRDPEELDDSQQFRMPQRPNPADKEILRGEVERSLQTLASHRDFKRDRAIFWLFYRYGYRDSEIAALVNLPVKTVQNILQKYVRVVRLKLRKDKGKGAPEE